MRKKFQWLWLSVIIIFLDQWTKNLAVHHLSLFQSMPIFKGLNFTLAFNYGAAFSFLDSSSGWQRWFFSGIAMVVVLCILIYFSKVTSRFKAIGLALIVGGALGNLWDRLTLGYVIDFIDCYFKHWHWPAFNLADSAITIGAILFLAIHYFSRDAH